MKRCNATKDHRFNQQLICTKCGLAWSEVWNAIVETRKRAKEVNG